MKSIVRYVLFFTVIVSLSSCRSYQSSYDYAALAKASVKLGVDIDRKDNHSLYVEASQWVGVPYHSGGMTKNGVDCSGLTKNIYLNVFNRTLPHSSSDQYMLCRRVAKRRLRAGDLVFFSSDSKLRKVDHVGVYLKNGYFIHSSSTYGVMVSKLNVKYYADRWVSGGRVF
jgi:lipoprotein Spr